jgi:hypothetical protein
MEMEVTKTDVSSGNRTQKLTVPSLTSGRQLTKPKL